MWFKKKKKVQNSGIKLLWQYLKPYTKQLIIVVLALLVSSSSVLIVSQSVRYMIDSGIAKHSSTSLNMAMLYLILLIILLAFGTACRTHFVTVIGEKVVADIRRALHSHILKLAPNYFEENKTGTIISMLTTDLGTIYTIVSGTLSIAMRNIVMLLGSISLLFIYSIKLTLVVFFMIPCVLVPIIVLARRARAMSKKLQDCMAEITAESENTLHNLKIIQAYGREDLSIGQFESKLQKELDTALKRSASRAILVTTVMILSFFGVIGVLWVGGNMVIDGEMSPGELSSFLLLTVLCAASAGALSDVIQNINKVFGIAERISEFLNISPQISENLNAIDLPKYTDSSILADTTINENNSIQDQTLIEFRDVTFYYPSKLHRPAVKNLNFTLPPGKIIAVVGLSGAGKSTIIQLLLRFYDVTLGGIYINGANIKDVKLHNLRTHFAYVSQDAYIFSDTIFANIAYGNPTATYDDVLKAAKAAAAWQFINTLPEGLDTFVGENGVRLSGGQKQRISIARAIVHNPNVLILDEATSALDSHNENKVRLGLKQLMKNRSALVIAHRLSTVMGADSIIVMHKGAIVEQGKHDELLRYNGHYANLLYSGELGTSE